MGIAINDNNLFTSFQSFPQLLFCQLDFGFDVDEKEKRNLFNKVIFFLLNLLSHLFICA